MATNPLTLIPLDLSQYPIGVYAPFPVHPEPCYGPDELGTDLENAIKQMVESFSKQESAARIYEVLQRWQARNFDRGYQFNTCDARGWGYGSAAGSPQAITARANSAKWFPFNVYGARKDKIVPAISRELPPLAFCAKNPDFGPDQVACDAREKYLEIYLADTDAKGLLGEIGGLMYTDDRIILLTESYADKQRWGTESAEQDELTGEPEIDAEAAQAEGEGQVPETERMPQGGAGEERPAVVEVTTAWGVLESKVSLVADEENDICAVRLSKERNVNLMKEKYPWIEDKISAGGGLTSGSDQMDRLARMNVRLAVQNSTVNGESWMADATESHIFFRPSQYRQIKKKDLRKVLYEVFPEGLRVTLVGTQIAFCRNQSMNSHIKILHSRTGPGQSRRAIGDNYLPIQKVVNANITLTHRYFQTCVPRRFALEGPINVAAMNAQRNDPALATAVDPNKLPPAGLDGVTSIEKVPQPTTGMMEYTQWLATDGAVAMDGATEAMFGTEDTDTFGAAKLNRDQALGVFGYCWSQICWGMAGAAGQAAESAAANRFADIRAKTPGQNAVSVELANMRGDALCYPKSVDMPETMADQLAKVAGIFENAATNPLYASIAKDPTNWPALDKFIRIPGVTAKEVDSVKKQQGEFAVLLKTAPVDNPQYLMAQHALESLQESVPQAVSPEESAQMQESLQQLEQVISQIPPLLPSVPVEQDDSVDHATEKLTCWRLINSEEGRKLKNGKPEEQAAFENLMLHYQGHAMMAAKLQPVPPVPVKANASVAIDKLPPEVAATALQAMGMQAKPESFENNLEPHEVEIQKQGIGSDGVPVKQTIKMAGKSL